MAVASTPARLRRPLSSDWTAGALNAWRKEKGLTVDELARLLGMSHGQVERRIYGRATIGQQLDRQIEGIEGAVRLGMPPGGSPAWLRRWLVGERGWPGLIQVKALRARL